MTQTLCDLIPFHYQNGVKIFLDYSSPCQIAPLYRPEKLGQFGDSVQFGVVQFGRDYCT